MFWQCDDVVKTKFGQPNCELRMVLLMRNKRAVVSPTCMCPVMHCMIGHNAGPVPRLRAISVSGKCSMLLTSAYLWVCCQQTGLHDC